MFLINLMLFQYFGMGCWGRVGLLEQKQIIMTIIIATANNNSNK